MIKVENFKTFTDEVIPVVYIGINNINIRNEFEGGYKLQFDFNICSDPDMRENIEIGRNNIEIDYDLTSNTNAVKTAYEYLNNLSTLKDGIRYPEKIEEN